MAPRGVGPRLTFEEVCQLCPGDLITELDGAAYHSVVLSTPVVEVDTTDGDRSVTFDVSVELEPGQPIKSSYLLREKYTAYGPRLYRRAPEPAPPVIPSLSSPRPGLGELDVLSGLDTLVLLGDLLAKVNAGGALLHPGFTSGLTLNSRNGYWVFLEADHFEFNAFTPEKAAEQWSDFANEPFRAVLAGYARKATQLLTPTHPNFPHSLLAQVFTGDVPAVPQPRPQQFDLNRVLQAYGTALQTTTSAPQLVFEQPAVPTSAPSDWELLVVGWVVFAAQLNLTQWLMHVAACEPTREVAQLLGAMARGELHDPSWQGFIPKLMGSYRSQEQLRAALAHQEPRLGGLLQLFAEVYAQPQRLEETYARQAAFRVLRAVLDQLTAPKQQQDLRRSVLASLMDGLYDLALAADEQGKVHTSMVFAQAALIALQLLPAPADPLEAETWLARVEMQEDRLSWHRLAEDQPLETQVVWQFAGNAGSFILAVLPFCDTVGDWYVQGRVTNQLWTAAWRALEQLRLALRLGYALSQQQPQSTEELGQQIKLALQHLLSHYQKALRNLTTMFTRTAESKHGLSGWIGVVTGSKDQESCLLRELRLSTAVYETLVAHGYGSEAIQKLGELVARG